MHCECINSSYIQYINRYKKCSFSFSIRTSQINSLINCEQIAINPFNKKLQPIELKRLKILNFYGYKSTFKITSICNFIYSLYHIFFHIFSLYILDIFGSASSRWKLLTYVNEMSMF